MKKALICFLFAFLPIQYGCSAADKTFDYSVDTAKISPSYDLLMERYGVVKSIATTKWDSFTHEEQKKLNLISNHVRLIETRVDRIRNKDIANMNGYRISIPELGYIHTLAKDAYTMAHEIATNHLWELSSSEILTLQSFDIQLKEMDDEIKSLTFQPSRTDVDHLLTSMLSIASASLKIIIPVVLGREIHATAEE